MMTCREFERLWSAGPGGELPAAARGHLAGCPICAAMARSDRETDAMLRRVRAGRPAVDAVDAWPAIERALVERAPGRAWWEGRRALALAGAGLAVVVAAVGIAVVMSRPVEQHRRLVVVARAPGGAEKRPGPGPGSVRPPVVHPTMMEIENI